MTRRTSEETIIGLQKKMIVDGKFSIVGNFNAIVCDFIRPSNLAIE